MEPLCKASTGAPEMTLVKPLYLPLRSKLSLLQVDSLRPKSLFEPLQRRERETMWHGLSGITLLSRHFNRWAQRHISDVQTYNQSGIKEVRSGINTVDQR